MQDMQTVAYFIDSYIFNMWHYSAYKMKNLKHTKNFLDLLDYKRYKATT